MEREQCRKDILPDRILLGHGVNNDMTVIIGWSAIKYIPVYILRRRIPVFFYDNITIHFTFIIL